MGKVIQFVKSLFGYPLSWRPPKPYWVMQAGKPMCRVPNSNYWRSQCYDG